MNIISHTGEKDRWCDFFKDSDGLLGEVRVKCRSWKLQKKENQHCVQRMSIWMGVCAFSTCMLQIK